MYNRKYEYEDTRSGGLEAVVGDYRIRIEPDDDTFGDTPRDWCNLGTMICFHRDYNLGDEHNYEFRDYDLWSDLAKAIEEDYGADCILRPIYIYDHSGIVLSLYGDRYPFNDRWDAGQVGFMVVSRETIRKEYGVKKVTKKILAKANHVLDCEIENYNSYLSGNVYGYVVEKKNSCECCHHTEWDVVDSLWGCYDLDVCIEDAEISLGHELEALCAKS